jgi:hypothetical protein
MAMMNEGSEEVTYDGAVDDGDNDVGAAVEEDGDEVCNTI